MGFVRRKEAAELDDEFEAIGTGCGIPPEPSCFIHKIKISLQELRATMVWLKIIARRRMCDVAQG
ncbi:MAG: hypothetical protein EAZ42_10140 [Verrucomicrobia bacterium]|nr:MAG: hypothetical protein EAZ42_10140 [Verrucomicrobiota bacterium]